MKTFFGSKNQTALPTITTDIGTAEVTDIESPEDSMGVKMDNLKTVGL